MNEQAVANIEAFFQRRAVQFGDIPRYNDITMWPFWLSLVPEPPENDDLFPSPLIQSLTGLGWPIAAGTYLDIPLRSQADAIYHIVNHKLTAFRGAATGEISALANNTAVTGVGTLFTTELQVGDTIAVTDDNGDFRFGVVNAIANNLALTLEAPFGPNAVTGAAATGLPAEYRIGNQWYETNPPHLTGGIQVAGVNVTGVGGTAFNTQLQVGQTINFVDDTGTHQYGIIATIPGAAAMTFTAATGAVAGANGVAYKLGKLPSPTFNWIRPLYNYLRTSMIIKSNNSVYLLGGNAELAGAQVYSPASLGAAAGGLLQRPHIQRALQGFNDGLGMLYTPFQMPKEGTLYLRVHNTHNLYTLFVNGAVFGYKVAV